MTDNSNDIKINNLNELKTDRNAERLGVLQDVFHREFGRMPAFYVNVPGRVNLIGEHVDYCGYPVLPMAIEQSILLAVAPADDEVLHITNTNDKYESHKCVVDSIEIKLPEMGIPPEWHSYFLCGVKGIHQELPKDAPKRGMLVTVSGNIPPASGLSSSSALVSAATLATSFVNEFSLNKKQLSNISADCERYIGTQGGGMDQAIAFLATEGCAQFIEWEPLRAMPTALPSDAHFVIANSLTRANKAATSDYNQRVIECRLACRILAKLSNCQWRKYERFAVLQRELKCDLLEFEKLADRNLRQDIYTRDDITKALEIGEDELEREFLTANTRHMEKFKLRQRALHVIQESLRVTQFREAAAAVDSVPELSRLMRESHRSLNEQYECSHTNLNRLIEISDRFGVGARLTGAGWGGCIVAICDSLEQSTLYIEELKSKYFNNLPEFNDDESENVVFVTSPRRGAEIYLEN